MKPERIGDHGFTVLPAVDVAGGRAAQVVGGTTSDPAAVALEWVRRGAGWLHLVDLDRAFGRGDNAALLGGLVRSAPVPVQLSGGLAEQESVADALATGAARVTLSSLALRDPAWVGQLVREHGARIAIGLDVRGDEVVARGTHVTVGPLMDVLDAVRGVGCETFVVADASRDGTLRGADEALFRRVCEQVGGSAVVASGGVASLDDLRRLRALRDTGVRGVVLGAALYRGAFTLEDALAVAAGLP